MPLTPFEEARACPKCNLTGEQTAERFLKVGRQQILAGVTLGAKIITFTCRNKRCKWLDTNWEVQVNPDGTIPDPKAPRESRFHPLDPALGARVNSSLESLLHESIEKGRNIR